MFSDSEVHERACKYCGYADCFNGECHRPKILHLTLKKKWFNLIASGVKNLEYREMRQYWITRLFTSEKVSANHTKYHSREYDEIHFKNGYGPNVPFMRVEYLGSSACDAAFCPCEHSEELKGDQIIIALGRVLEVRHRARY